MRKQNERHRESSLAMRANWRQVGAIVVDEALAYGNGDPVRQDRHHPQILGHRRVDELLESLLLFFSEGEGESGFGGRGAAVDLFALALAQLHAVLGISLIDYDLRLSVGRRRWGSEDAVEEQHELGGDAEDGNRGYEEEEEEEESPEERRADLVHPRNDVLQTPPQKSLLLASSLRRGWRLGQDRSAGRCVGVEIEDASKEDNLFHVLVPPERLHPPGQQKTDELERQHGQV